MSSSVTLSSIRQAKTSEDENGSRKQYLAAVGVCFQVIHLDSIFGQQLISEQQIEATFEGVLILAINLTTYGLSR